MCIYIYIYICIDMCIYIYIYIRCVVARTVQAESRRGCRGGGRGSTWSINYTNIKRCAILLYYKYHYYYNNK